jgi:hypothetical protein
VFFSDCSPDGKYFAIEGLKGSLDKPARVANLYEGATGKKLGELPTQSPASWDSGWFTFDPTGTVLNYGSFRENPAGRHGCFLEMPTRAVLRLVDDFAQCVGPQAKRWVMRTGGSADRPNAFKLYDQERHGPLVSFLLHAARSKPQFSQDGSYLVWGNDSGTLTVVDLVEVNRRLSELGLGW